MRIAVFANSLGLGGTEKAACRWVRGLRARGHEVCFISLELGPRAAELEHVSIPVEIATSPEAIVEVLQRFRPDVIHAHAPGVPHAGDALGEALRKLSKIPVVQTNIFGRLENPAEDQWVDFRLFISWTSCVQAARRSRRKLDSAFFEHCSVAVYPLDPEDGLSLDERRAFRHSLGIADEEIVLGRLSRPEPNKWTDLPIRAFRRAARSDSRIRLLLREAPPGVAEELRHAPDSERYILLPATNDQRQLRQTLSALDVVLHTSSIGESFGYGIAEPMNFGVPVITTSVPWGDQAQIELVRPGEGGFVASTPKSLACAITRLSTDAGLRRTMGERARAHIRQLADPTCSLDRLEDALRAAIAGIPNPRIEEDLGDARRAAAYLDACQFDGIFQDRVSLHGHLTFLRVRTVIRRCWRMLSRSAHLLKSVARLSRSNRLLF